MQDERGRARPRRCARGWLGCRSLSPPRSPPVRASFLARLLPARSTPVRTTPVQTTPVQTTLARTTLARTTLAQTTLARAEFDPPSVSTRSARQVASTRLMQIYRYIAIFSYFLDKNTGPEPARVAIARIARQMNRPPDELPAHELPCRIEGVGPSVGIAGSSQLPESPESSDPDLIGAGAGLVQPSLPLGVDFVGVLELLFHHVLLRGVG